MPNFYDDVICKDARYTTTEGVRDLALLEPAFKEKVHELIAQAKSRGVDLMITETYRSKERQAMLFAQGKTKLKDVGVHHYGLAVDFAKLESGKAQWGGDWSFLGEICLKLGLIWGGDWGKPLEKHTFRDMDHVQGCGIEQQAALFKGTWYPAGPAGEGAVNA